LSPNEAEKEDFIFRIKVYVEQNQGSFRGSTSLEDAAITKQVTNDQPRIKLRRWGSVILPQAFRRMLAKYPSLTPSATSSEQAFEARLGDDGITSKEEASIKD
jgi:hypothetical protein